MRAGIARVCVVAWVVASGTALAGPRLETSYKVVPPVAGAETSKTIYLNRCTGGCTVRLGSTEDARTQTSTIPDGTLGQMFTLDEFAWGDTEWTDLVSCLRQVFSPYAVTLIDSEPVAVEHYGEAIIAGTPGQIGVSQEFGGFAPITFDCTPIDYAISFTFANLYQQPFERVHELCATAAQEIAHTYGLDHEFSFNDDGSSACTDPMTYQVDCGGQRFFRNRFATCGEYAPRPCRCGPKQTSHGVLFARLGQGTPTTTVSVAISSPADGSAITDGITVHVPASAERGIASVELWLNGFLWQRTAGAPFGIAGQPATDYTFTLPPDVPDGVIDIQAIARDDLPMTSMATVTVTKGAPCTSADACATGQQCADGRCFWDPPSGEIGDACDYPQFCLEGRCDTHDGASFCTHTCNPTATGICGVGLDCVATSEFEGYCWPPDTGGGCCSSAPVTPWAPLALAAIVLPWALRRRRASATR